MSDARRQIDWETMFALAIDGEKAQAYYESTPTEEKHSCSMCGKMCAMRTTNMILDGQSVSLRFLKINQLYLFLINFCLSFS